MNARKIMALVVVELKKTVRDLMSLAMLLLFPIMMTLVYYFALGNVQGDYNYPVPGMSHFEYLLPGVMGYAVIYMGMIVALALVEYRQVGLLDRIEIAPISTAGYLLSQIIANMIIATTQGLLVLVVAYIVSFRPFGGVIGILITALFLALLAVTAVGLALLITAVSKDTGTAGGISAIFIVPMMMFGALLVVFNEATLRIAKFMPNYYVSDTLIRVLHLGNTSDPVVWENLLTLLAIDVFVVAAGIWLFSRTKAR
jgi:ABC-2 type transport system permease protein